MPDTKPPERDRCGVCGKLIRPPIGCRRCERCGTLCCLDCIEILAKPYVRSDSDGLRRICLPCHRALRDFHPFDPGGGDAQDGEEVRA